MYVLFLFSVWVIDGRDNWFALEEWLLVSRGHESTGAAFSLPPSHHHILLTLGGTKGKVYITCIGFAMVYPIAVYKCRESPHTSFQLLLIQKKGIENKRNFPFCGNLLFSILYKSLWYHMITMKRRRRSI